MNRQHPRPHARGNIMLITITVSEILDHCQNLLDDPRKTTTLGVTANNESMYVLALHVVIFLNNLSVSNKLET